jgi:16S rRNA (guanine527-N7)-methyltransferase
MGVPRETEELARDLFGSRFDTANAYAHALGTSGVERGLLGPREVPRIWDRHLLNCVVLKDLIPDGVDLADVGSGAGLPGIPLAIARPDLVVHLVEPLLRRVVWLQEIVCDLKLANVNIIRAKANLVVESGQDFDIVTARAVAPLSTLAEWCLPLTRPGGEFLAIQGDSAADELTAAEPTLKALNAAAWSVELCGAETLETPTTAVRVVAGTSAKAASKRAAKPKRAAPAAGSGAAGQAAGKRRSPQRSPRR